LTQRRVGRQTDRHQGRRAQRRAPSPRL